MSTVNELRKLLNKKRCRNQISQQELRDLLQRRSRDRPTREETASEMREELQRLIRGWR